MIRENLALAIFSLKANKMRALLTMLGIIIGIMSVIAIVTIGNALTASVTSNLSAFSTNNISVYVQQKSQNDSLRMDNVMIFGGGGGGGGGGAMVSRSVSIAGGWGGRMTPSDSDLISVEMVNAFKEAYPDQVEGVSYSYSAGNGTARDKDLYANVNITGVNADYILANTMTILDGRFISDKDGEKYRKVCVVSDKLAAKMFPGEDPLGQQVKIYRQNTIDIYVIVGVYQYQQTGFGFDSTASEEDLTTNLFIPVSTAKRDLLEKNYSQITVVASKDTDVIPFTSQLTGYFDELYKNNSTWGVSASSMEEQLNTISDTLGTIAMAIAFIAAISLVVGGIGIMNIMLVSVTERTREIGTRKALGAKNFHIRLQFVVEAVIISGIGGVIGVILGTAAGIGVTVFMNAPITVSAWVILVSVLFSMTIGIFFGLYPANKAAKLDPIEALRYE